jgi:hypothetical protein
MRDLVASKANHGTATFGQVPARLDRPPRSASSDCRILRRDCCTAAPLQIQAKCSENAIISGLNPAPFLLHRSMARREQAEAAAGQQEQLPIRK